MPVTQPETPAPLATPTPALARLNLVVSPLRRALLAAARAAEGLPDIPDAQIEVLRAIPGGVRSSPGELAEQLGLSRSTVSNLLRSMESAGLVERVAQAGDGRRVEVRATTRALELLVRFDEASAVIVGDALAELEPAERDALAAALPALERLRGVVERRARR
ncbi:MarR family winged helix-turn-helix transcriptional regulator [Agromyces sp. NPDC058126]|uniref:MarR family winged helix-turn-helix transcriptional regulator n=1 Tax=Agromyces sp. NPDC058126 TaxID=3346350 RepID=UPI0036DE1794